MRSSIQDGSWNALQRMDFLSRTYACASFLFLRQRSSTTVTEGSLSSSEWAPLSTVTWLCYFIPLLFLLVFGNSNWFSWQPWEMLCRLKDNNMDTNQIRAGNFRCACRCLTQLIASGPIVAMELVGENAICRWRLLLGKQSFMHKFITKYQNWDWQPSNDAKKITY